MKQHYSIIIIGGGIQGATMVWEAALRGIPSLLIEQNDFGSGVSANSLKIIHGGIRYLQSLDFPRMRQSIRERRTFLRLAPHLVEPIRCIIPAYRSPGKGRFALWVGTRLYDCASVDRNRGLDPSRALGKSSTLSSNALKGVGPGIWGSEISGGASWYDARVNNSERLVLAFIMSAKSMGADVCNYMRADEVICERRRVRGIRIRDVLSGNRIDIQADVIMDCRGPWFGKTIAGSDMHYTKAMNLVIQRRLANIAFGVKGKGNSHRSLFYAPWREGGMIGTWYSESGSMNDPDALSVSGKIILEALSEFNSVLNGPSIRVQDVTAVQVGLLPALSGRKHSGNEPAVSDKFMIVDGAAKGEAGMFHVQGVKYTTARDVSVRALKAAFPYLAAKPGRSAFRVPPLYGGNIGLVDGFYDTCLREYSPRFSSDTVKRLIGNYGSQIHRIMAYAGSSPELAQIVPGTKNILLAELEFVLDHEMVWNLSDLLFRRTALGSFSRPSEQTISFCADWMAKKMGWDAGVRNKNISNLQFQFPQWMPVNGFEEKTVFSRSFK